MQSKITDLLLESLKFNGIQFSFIDLICSVSLILNSTTYKYSLNLQQLNNYKLNAIKAG